MTLTEYWKQRDLNTGETWLSFAQRTDMDALSIAYGQSWQEHIESRAKRPEAQIEAPKNALPVLEPTV